MEIVERMISVATKDFVTGSIKRSKYQKNNRQYLYKYHDIKADFLNGNDFCKDYYIDEIYKQKMVTKEEYNHYYSEMKDYLSKTMEVLEITEEKMYAELLKIRAKHFSKYTKGIHREGDIDQYNEHDIDGIHQVAVLKRKLKDYEHLYLCIEEIKYIKDIESFYYWLVDEKVKITLVVKENHLYPDSIKLEDIKRVLFRAENSENEEDIIHISNEEIGIDFSTFSVPENSGFICFGEWFLGANKNLNVDSYVMCTSEEIVTRDACNTSDKKEVQFIYIPKKYNLIEHLECIEISKYNYRVISFIYNKIGEKVYQLAFEDLVDMFPEYFINYKSDYLIDYIPMKMKQDFYIDRIDSIVSYIESRTNGLAFDQKVLKDANGDDMRVVAVSIDQSLQNKLKVKGFHSATNIREYYRNRGKKEIGIVSNFLFFSTDISMALYNKIRAERVKEQYSVSGWHLDYKLEDAIETVPVYNKACVALTNDGNIVFGQKKLETGEFIVNDYKIKVDETIINQEKPGDISIYTPMYCKSESDDFRKYSEPVGSKRVNLVFINNDIVCVREGSVLLPNAGVILSFTKDKFSKIIGDYDVRVDENGYYENLPITCRYQSTFAKEHKWAYGGGMFLIKEGVALSSEDDIITSFRKEGWMNALSKQTQGSLTYKNTKHPRTVIGKTKTGDFFIIVCTGRSKYSVGADYLDLINIAKELYTDIEYLMNVDGGASSMLGVTIDGEVIPLTDITYTDDSAAGEIRSLNSIMYLET